MEFKNNNWKDGLSDHQLTKIREIEERLSTALRGEEDFEVCLPSRPDPSVTFTKDPLSVSSMVSNSSGVVITVEEGDGQDLFTPTASPNTSFEEAKNAASHISPSLRNLGPGYVSNLAQFWALKSKQCQDMNSFFNIGGFKFGDSAVGTGANGEQFLEENETFMSEVDPSQLKETLFVQCEMIRDLEEDKAKLNVIIDGLKTKNDEIGESVRELEELLESKSHQVEYLRESLNNCNDKVTKLLKEDLEKNYRIIELEGTIEDLNF